MRAVLLVLFVALPLLGTFLVQRAKAENEARLGAIASEIAGRDVEVHCPGFFERLADVSANSGSVHFSAGGRPASYAELNHATCSRLDDLAEGDTGADDEARVARAIHVLAHESVHLAGVRDEAIADCYAFQRTSYVAGRLGAEPERARALALLAFVERSRTAPREYRSSECRDGGGLDLNPETSAWP